MKKFLFCYCLVASSLACKQQESTHSSTHVSAVNGNGFVPYIQTVNGVNLSDTLQSQSHVDLMISQISKTTHIARAKIKVQKIEYSFQNRRNFWEKIASGEVKKLMQYSTEVIFSNLTPSECKSAKKRFTGLATGNAVSRYNCNNPKQKIKLSELLPVQMQALNHHRLENVFQRVDNQNYLTQSNCWSTVYSIAKELQDGTTKHTLFMAPLSKIEKTFLNKKWFTEIIHKTIANPKDTKSITQEVTQNTIPGDIVLFYSAGQLRHMAYVAADGVFFEKTGFMNLHPYRTVSIEETIKLWVEQKNGNKLIAMRLNKGVSLPKPEGIFSNGQIGKTYIYKDINDNITKNSNPYVTFEVNVNSSSNSATLPQTINYTISK